MNRYAGTRARTRAEIAEAQRLRWRVYGEEEKLLPVSACRGGREVDARDRDPGTAHFIVRVGEEVVGTVRLSFPAPTPALAALAPWGCATAEITRFCVLRAYRNTGVTPALFAALRAESARRGITHWVAAANTETTVAHEAALACGIARAKGYAAQASRGGARDQTAPDLDYVLANLDLPRTLSVFARRMGARFAGGPVYDPYFGVFALPLVVALTGAPEARLCTSTT